MLLKYSTFSVKRKIHGFLTFCIVMSILEIQAWPFGCTFLYRLWLFFLNKLMVCGYLAVIESISTIFQQHLFNSFVCVKIGNSCNISKFFIIFIFLVAICDQGSLLLLPPLTEGLKWWLAYFSSKEFLN